MVNFDNWGLPCPSAPLMSYGGGFFIQPERIQYMKRQQRILVLKASKRNEKRLFVFTL